MSGGRCQRWKMMGRGAEGGCGTEEKPCPVSRVSSSAASCTAKSQSKEQALGIDLYSQARKALTEHSPFDTEESISRVSTLPVGLAAALSRHSESRRKHKKAHAEPSAKPSANPPGVSNVWADTEEYFRAVTLADVDYLNPQLPFGSSLDSCLSIPVLQNVAVQVPKDVVLDVVEESSNLASVTATVEEEEGVKEAAAAAEQQQQQQQQQPMDIDHVGAYNSNTDNDNVPQEEVGNEDNPSINWLLGSKHRTLLTSERPSKKRKFLGSDAGLERLLLLPHPQGQDSSLCDYCCHRDNASRSTQFLRCNSCKVLVHQKCYGLHEVPVGAWVCSWCRQLEVAGKSLNKDGEGPCLLCPKGGGVLKPVAGDEYQNCGTVKYAHLFCSLWMPEVYVEDTESMEPVKNVGGVHTMRRKLVCYLCKVKHGSCIRCSHGTCRTSFHPICARAAKHRMEIWGKVGCDNVELRAFCSKHSAFQDIGSVQHSGNLTVAVGSDSSVANTLPLTTPANGLPKIRLTHKSMDKSFVQDKTTDSCPDKVNKNELTLEKDVVVVRLRSDYCDGAQGNMNIETADISESGNAVDNSPSDISNLVLLLKKLLDRGKINVHDVASGIGISSDSLEAALSGEPTSLSAELRLKIINWVQDSVHLAAPVRHSNSRSAKLGGPDGSSAVKVAGCYDSNADKVAGLDVVDAVLVKSLPPRRRTKSTIRILKDNEIVCLEGDTFIQENRNGKVVGDISESPTVVNESMKNVTDNDSPSDNKDCCNKEQEFLETVARDASMCPGFKNLPGHEGNLTKVKNNDTFDKHCQQELTGEIMSSLGTCIDQADECNITVKNTLMKAMGEHKGCDIGSVLTGLPGLKVNEPCSGSYIHPFIQKRLMQMQNSVIFKQENRDANLNVEGEKDASYKEAIISASNFPCEDMSHTLDAARPEQLAVEKDKGILVLSPDDEVEGEIVHLQNRLLDNAVAVKHHCEDLIFRVVGNLPQELDALKKQRWDSVLVNQFLREVREAKKRGRKERRHKEAQAVLAAAAAAAAASSRMSSLRKDTNDEIISAHQESPLKVDASCGRAVPYSPLIPRAKEAISKLSCVKISSEKHSEISVQSCDICRRNETMLNPIFVCGSCKVAVHLDCYRRIKHPINSWYCELCEELRLQSRSIRNPFVVAHCGLCGASAGAFRKSTEGQWIHAFCAEWVFESTFRRGQANPVEGMDAISKEKDLLICCICHQKVGVCLKCSYGHCQITFHPYCAKNAGLYMSVKNISGKFQHKAYCEKHSLEHREKADTQQHGAEELKTIKQLRVELERVRLLCERIIKREKLKRELVLCSHDILASKRDYVAFSVLVRSSFYPPGVSSESATTSINTKSFSEAIQRSDDITVDSTVSGKRKVSHSLHLDIDRKTDDSSTSQLRSMQKTADRMPFSGKQLPQRSASIAFRNVTDGERRSKLRKQTETFQKELVMTSDQATMQNQRLPKGFAYVPIDCISKAHNIEACESQEPNG